MNLWAVGAGALAGVAAGRALNLGLERWTGRGAGAVFRLPVLEVAAGALWALAAARWGLHPESLRGGLFLAILLGIAVGDARSYLIPDRLSLGGLCAGLALAPLDGGPAVRGAVAGAALGFGLLWGVAVVARGLLGRDALGGGDVKMMAMAGAFLGPGGMALALFAGSLLGTVIFGPAALRTGRLVPFGVFLALGCAVAYGWGDPLIGWYLGLVAGGG